MYLSEKTVTKTWLTNVSYLFSCRHLRDPQASLEAMLRPKVTALPGHIQSIFVQNIIKLYSRILVKAELEEDDETIKEAGQLLIDKLPMFVQSADLEVQERVRLRVFYYSQPFCLAL